MIIRHLNWKLELKELKDALMEYRNPKPYTDKINKDMVDRINIYTRSIRIFILLLLFQTFMGITVGFHTIDIILIVSTIVNIIIRMSIIKKIKMSVADANISLALGSAVSGLCIEHFNMDNILNLDIPGELGDKLKAYNTILNADIKEMIYTNNTLKVICIDDTDIILNIPVHIHDGECDAITINSYGLFIGLHSNVAMNNVNTKEVNIPLIIGE